MYAAHRTVRFETIDRKQVTRMHTGNTGAPRARSPLQNAVISTYNAGTAVAVPVPTNIQGSPEKAQKFADKLRSSLYDLAKDNNWSAHGVMSADGTLVQLWVDDKPANRAQQATV